MSRRKKKAFQIPKVKMDVLQQINQSAAGVDIGSEEHWVAVPETKGGESVRRFGSTTKQLHQIADWLSEHQIRTVAMESTGSYWVPLYEVLESAGFEVLVVHAQYVKAIGGRKTDAADCQWIQQLHTYGLLRECFRPNGQIRQARTVMRQRSGLIGDLSRQILKMQKALDLMNVQVHRAVSDISGKTGMAIIKAILRGTRKPRQLAALRDRRCRRSELEIADALTGNYREEHLFALRQAHNHYTFILNQVAECDDALERCLMKIDQKISAEQVAQIKLQGRKRVRKGTVKQPQFDWRGLTIGITGVDLTQIEGVGPSTILTLVTEIGADTSPWKTVKQFCSWLALCPGNKKSGGKVLSTKTKRSANRIAAALRMSASTLKNSHGPLGDYYRRMKSKMGPAQAITAAAHKLARIIYALLRDGHPYQSERVMIAAEKQKERLIRYLTKKAVQIGCYLTPMPDELASG